jgi:hypothetical protein
MRRGAVALLLPLLVACSSGPSSPFDTGYDVHFILHAHPPPETAFRVHPVCTVGDQVRKATQVAVGPGEPAAREVAVLRASRGSRRISMWEPRTRSGGRATADVARDLWVVLDLKGRFRIFEKPPHEEIGGWVPLVAVPD